jgi:hypothetical protein
MPEDRLLQPEEAADMSEWFSLGEPSDRELWKSMYGFDHDCKCSEDVDSGNLESVPACFLEAVDQAFPALRKMRGYLFTIATAPISDVAALKSLAAAALNMPVSEEL